MIKLRNKYILKQHIEHKKLKNKDNKINWWELALIGIGSIIGAGFFLGSEIVIRLAGTGSIWVYVLSGITAYIVFTALAEMSINDPEEGSFKDYACKAYGCKFAFISGWIYWLSGVLIMASSVIALSVFTQFWFQDIPIWLLSVIYSAVSFFIVLLGVDDFAKTESIFALLKIVVLIVFILFGLLIFLEIIDFSETSKIEHIQWFSQGIMGPWQGMIYALLPFCGIGTIGILSTDLDEPRNILKSGRVILLSLLILYTIPLFIILNFVPIEKIQQNQSPFLTLLLQYNFPWVDSIFNSILILATFSTLVGSIYCITKMFHAMADHGDAPRIFTKINKRKVPTNALYLSASGLIGAIVFSYLLSETIYEHLIGCASIMLVSNWIIILLSQRKLRKNEKNMQKFIYKMAFFPWLNYLGLIIVIASLVGALTYRGLRYSVIGTVIIIIFLYYIACRVHRND